MKHIKSKKVFELFLPGALLNKEERNIEEVINTIKDICIELEDEGFSINIAPISTKNDYVIVIKKISDHVLLTIDEFFYSDVEEVVNRLDEYISKENIKSIDVIISGVAGWFNITNSNTGHRKIEPKELPFNKICGVKINFII